MLENFGLPYKAHLVGLYAGTMATDLAPLAPARTVPVLRCADGSILYDSLAMAEELATRHPDAGLWPGAPGARALARSMTSEMHSGFPALRSECPMQLFHQWVGFEASAPVLAELERLELLFSHARKHAPDGPWLFGAYSMADVFYAPLMARIAGYGLAVGPEMAAYVETTLTDPAFVAWRKEGVTVSYDPFPYPQELPKRNWPGFPHKRDRI